MMIIFSMLEGEEQVDSAILNHKIPHLNEYFSWEVERSDIPRGMYRVERVTWHFESTRVQDSSNVRIQLAPVP